MVEVVEVDAATALTGVRIKMKTLPQMIITVNPACGYSGDGGVSDVGVRCGVGWGVGMGGGAQARACSRSAGRSSPCIITGPIP